MMQYLQITLQRVMQFTNVYVRSNWYLLSVHLTSPTSTPRSRCTVSASGEARRIIPLQSQCVYGFIMHGVRTA